MNIRVGLAALALTVGCGESTVPNASVVSVVVVPLTATVTVGQTTPFAAFALDANGDSIRGKTFDWSSSAPAVASVDGSGLVTGVAVGQSTITATSEAKSGSATVTVTQVAVDVVQVSPGAKSLAVGDTATFTATTKDANGNVLTGRTVLWSSSDTSKVTVTIAGQNSAKVIARAVGSATITAASEGKTGTGSVSVYSNSTVEPQPSGTSVTLFSDDFESYNGTCLSMVTAGGGPWLRGPTGCSADSNDVISSKGGTGYVGSAAGIGGRSAMFDWPESTTEQFYPLERPVTSVGNGKSEYCTFYYRAPGFVYATTFPRIGKKHFLFFPAGGNGRLTSSYGSLSILQSNNVKIDTLMNPWPGGSDPAFKAILTNGEWHRFTAQRRSESVTGAMDGMYRQWFDGQLVFNLVNIGTYDVATTSFEIASTFNGGSSKRQQEYFDNIVCWRDP